MTKECYFCGRQVDPLGPFTYRLVLAWQRGDKKLSKLRAARDRYACDGCITRKERGINPTQMVFPSQAAHVAHHAKLRKDQSP